MNQFPVVAGHFAKKSDLRYTEMEFPPVSLNQWIDRDLLFLYAVWPLTWWKVGLTQYWMPLFINLAGDWTGTTDENGNNFNNFLILFWEQEGVWGLAKYYNLFNMEGWTKMNWELILRVFLIYIGVEPWIVLIKWLTGELQVNDFDDPNAQ